MRIAWFILQCLSYNGDKVSPAASAFEIIEGVLMAIDPQLNPFTALASIGAPAILTNACSILIQSTSTRLGRAVDRARALATELEAPNAMSNPNAPWLMQELDAAQLRMVMLIRALRSFYIAIGGFAVAALVAITGAIAAPMIPVTITTTLEIFTLCAGFVAVGGLVHGAQLLVRETRATVNILTERAARVQADFASKKKALSSRLN
jgi:hypothetical protein